MSFLAGMDYTLPFAKNLLKAAIVLSTTNSVLNPLLYLYKRKEFRVYLRNMLIRRQNSVEAE